MQFSLEHHSDLDVIDNLATRPPDGEFVLTLCANVADALRRLTSCNFQRTPWQRELE